MFRALSVDESLMKRTLILFIFLVSTVAQAGLNLVIEHPRNPSHKKDSYKIDCAKKCALEIVSTSPVKGEVDEKFESKVKAIWSLGIPKDVNIRESRVLYTVTAVDGEKKISFKVGHPNLYEGEELSKYLGVISYIEELKRTMRSELQGEKK